MKTQKDKMFLRELHLNPRLAVPKKIDFKTKKMVKDALQSPFGLSIVNMIKIEIKKII